MKWRRWRTAGLSLVLLAEIAAIAFVYRGYCAETIDRWRYGEPKDWKTLNWHKDYDQALEEAKRVGKPVLIDFTTDWCGWCRVLERNTFSHPMVWEAMNERVVLCRIDADKEKEIANKYEVLAYPTIIVVDGKGETLIKEEGYKEPKEFYRVFLEKIK